VVQLRPLLLPQVVVQKLIQTHLSQKIGIHDFLYMRKKRKIVVVGHPVLPFFYMATIGAAVGFGNVWRFPALCVDYDGGAFFVPHLMALFKLGIPLTVLEIGFG
jgi:hypothetical protein